MRWQSRTFAASDTLMHWMRLGGRFMPIRGLVLRHAVLAAALLRTGRAAEAKAAAQDVLEHEPTFTIHGVRLVAGGLEPAVFKPFAEAWREIGLPE